MLYSFIDSKTPATNIRTIHLFIKIQSRLIIFSLISNEIRRFKKPDHDLYPIFLPFPLCVREKKPA